VSKLEAPDTVPERGTLEEQSLPLVLLLLYRRRYGGTLRVARDGVEKRVFLRDGVPVMAESNLPSESLGIQLMDAGRITRDDYARVVETVRTRKCKEGAALLGLQLVAPKELYEALKHQVRRRLLDCLGWARGEFTLEAGETKLEDANAFRCDPVALVQEAVAIHWSPSALRAHFADRRERFAAATPRTEALLNRLHRDADVEGFIAGLGGGDPFATWLDAAAAPTALAAAWVLDTLGALSFADEASRDDADAGDAPNHPEIEVFVRDAASASGAKPAPASAAARPAAKPTAAATAAADAKLEALRKELLALRADLDGRDHYKLLGVGQHADAAAVRRAYVDLAKRFHPDAITRRGLTDLRDVAEVVFARIAEAHEVLADPNRRRDYDRGDQNGAEDMDVARVVQAETLFRKAEILLRAGNFAGALEFLRPAIGIWPEECAYQSALGWALYKKAPPDAKTAREHLEKAVALDRADAVAHFRLGVVLRALGEKEAGEAALARAKQLDPQGRS
jgi:tetratricopeptide (TPR) repeat protein